MRRQIPYEVFGSFSLRNEEIKRVEIAFLLDKWVWIILASRHDITLTEITTPIQNEVRASPAMKQVFNQSTLLFL